MFVMIRIRLILLIFTIVSPEIFAQGICEGQQVVVAEDGECPLGEYVLVFEDEFEGNELNENIWQIQPWAQGALQGKPNQEYNTLENVNISNGFLYITAKDETVLRRAVSYHPDDYILEDALQNLRYYDYTSSNIWTKKKFSHGIFEIRCKLPKGKGFFPAFWTFGGPGWNEIDVFEFWNEKTNGQYDPDKLSKVHNMNAHYNPVADGTSINCSTDYSGSDFSVDFHTFSVEWTPYSLKWYVDGNLKRTSTLFYTLLGQTVGCNGIDAFTPYLMDKAFPKDPMSIIVNLAIQAGDNAPDNDTPFPSSLMVDYIRYYQRMPCNGSVVITNQSDLNLSNELWNVIVGSSVYLAGNLTVEAGEQLEVIGQSEIVIGSGFHAEEGSEFHAHIDPAFCSGLNKLDNGESDDEFLPPSPVANEIEFSDTLNEIRVFPNPTSNTVTVDITSDDTYEIFVVDKIGKVVLNRLVRRGNSSIDLSTQSNGSYLLLIINTDRHEIVSHPLIISK